MIISTNLLPAILRVVQGATTGSLIPISFPFPYRWNPIEKKFYVSKSYPSYWWIVVLCVCSTVPVSQTIFRNVSATEPALWEVIHRAHISIACLLVGIYFVAFHKFQSPAVCEYLNKLMGFEKRHVPTCDQKNLKKIRKQAYFISGFTS